MIRLPSDINVYNLIDDLRGISLEASEVLLYYSKILKDLGYKNNILRNHNEKDPVTIADLKVNSLVIKRIKEKYINVNWEILSEENVKIETSNFNTNLDWRWVLDPLDGTKDFIQGTSNYAMHLSLNYKHKPFIGVVLIPERDELWIYDSEKVWCEKRDGTKTSHNLSKNKVQSSMELGVSARWPLEKSDLLYSTEAPF